MDYLFRFGGRLRRSNYFVGMLVFNVAAFFAGLIVGGSEEMAPIMGLVVIGITIFQINLAVRRFNDMDWSGWNFLLLLIPLVNVAILLILLFKKGTNGPNKYGEDTTVKMMINDMV